MLGYDIRLRLWRDLRFALHVDVQKWPDWVYVVRHGLSDANVARDAAEEAGRCEIGVSIRDASVSLAQLGWQQGEALGRWIGSLPPQQRPTVILVSPYLRAVQTSEAILRGAGLSKDELTYVIDERLREKEFGILEGLTKQGIAEKFPVEFARRQEWGKFHYRPPGGESWCDVIFRLRSINETMIRDYAGERVMIVCHSVVVQCFRYLFERMDEEQILQIDKDKDVANCSTTIYRFDRYAGKRGKLLLQTPYFLAPGVVSTNPKDMPPPKH